MPDNTPRLTRPDDIAALIAGTLGGKTIDSGGHVLHTPTQGWYGALRINTEDPDGTTRTFQIHITPVGGDSGVWIVAPHADGSASPIVYSDEIDALRFAVSEGRDVYHVPYGTSLQDAINARQPR